MYPLLKQCTPIQSLVYSVQGVLILPPNLDAQSILDERNAEKLVIEPFVEVGRLCRDMIWAYVCTEREKERDNNDNKYSNNSNNNNDNHNHNHNS